MIYPRSLICALASVLPRSLALARVFVFFCALLCIVVEARGQAGAPVVRVQPPAFNIQRAQQPGVVRPPSSSQEQFDLLMASSAQLDIDSPVTVRTEFDPPTASLGSRVVFRLSINALDESVKVPDQLPAPAGLTLTPGGRAQSMQIVQTGRQQAFTTINFRATPAGVGTYVVPSFKMTAYGKEVVVPETRLTVVSANESALREAPRVILQVPPGEYYVGQTLKCALVLPDPGDGSVQAIMQSHITGEGVFVEPPVVGQRREILQLNGQSVSALIQELTVNLMRSGTQTMIAQTTAYGIRRNPNQLGSMQATTLVDSDPFPILVNPLPTEGRLPGFNGMVGSYQVDAPRLSTNSLKAGEPLVLTVTIRGEGNLGRLTPPQVPLQREWQTFPAISEGANPVAIQQRGFVTFSYTMIPLTDRIKATPAIPFSCFDPKKKAFVDLTLPPVAVKVLPVSPELAAQLQNNSPNTFATPDDGNRRERELVLSGLAEKPGATAIRMVPLQESSWFALIQLVPALALTGFWLWARRRAYLEAHPEILLRRRARRGIRRHLQATSRAASARDSKGFVTSAISALREASAPRGAANPDSLVCADVLAELPQPERQGRAGEMVRQLFAMGDALRYGGPVKEGPDLFSLKPDLEQLVHRLGGRW